MDLEGVSRAFQLGYKSLVNFRKVFMPSKDECTPAPFHYNWDKILREGERHIAVEAFRESGKSQIVIRGHTLYRLVYPSEKYDYIILLLANQTLAENKLKDITDEYMSDPILSANLVKVNRQSAKVFDAVVLDVNGQTINVRIEAYGKGSSIRGLSNRDRRPKLIIGDDLQDLEDSNSQTVQDKDWNWFLSDVLFLGQNCRIFLIGNNLGERCLIEQIIANADDLGFDVMKIPILDEAGKSTWPSKWPVEDIEKNRQAFTNMGKLDVWYREKMCIAVSPDTQRFKKEMFKYYDPETLKKEGFSIYTTIDLASSEKQSSDYRVVFTIGVNKEGHWFVLDVRYGRYDPSELMDQIFDVVSKWKPLVVGFEKVGYQAVLEHYLLKEMPKRNIFFAVKPLIADKKKTLRIEALQPRFVAGTVWFPENKPFMTELESELLSFTPSGCKSKHDDVVDAFAYMEQIAVPPTSGFKKVDTEDIPYAGLF